MLKRWFKRLSVDETDRRAIAIREWVVSVPGVTLIEAAQPRSVVRIAGVVESMRVQPREGLPAIEAVVWDGSGSVTAVWLGRRSMPGLTLGVRLILEGRLGGRPGSMQIMNPTFDFAPAPGRH